MFKWLEKLIRQQPSCCEEIYSCCDVGPHPSLIKEKYRCKRCGHIFVGPMDFVTSCIICEGCKDDGKVIQGCPWCDPETTIERIDDGITD